jgi:hypothetical protein
VWPQCIPESVCLESCSDYREAPTYTEPPTCASCSRSKIGLVYYDVPVLSDPSDSRFVELSVLRLSDPQLVRFFADEFAYPHPVLNGLMLCRAGIVFATTDLTFLRLCDPCLASLRSPSLPKFSLKNRLYRGVLPDRLCDLTWIEEMACSIYRTTAHVTRLYQTSSNPADPLVLHGNTCAHDMNLISTVSVSYSGACAPRTLEWVVLWYGLLIFTLP